MSWLCGDNVEEQSRIDEEIREAFQQKALERSAFIVIALASRQLSTPLRCLCVWMSLPGVLQFKPPVHYQEVLLCHLL